ncbi:MAG: two-component sensor histidine kinase, partial [Brevundimonas sp.]|nr:two-component sensor histidine kinase [Brevundimonas sp.]
DTLAARLFLLLLIGAVMAAAAALLVSEVGHRRHLAQLHDFATAERIGDLAGQAVADGGSGADGLAGALPEASAAQAGKPDPALTRAVSAALDRRGVEGVRVAAYEAASQACGMTGRHSRNRCRILTLTVPGAATQAPPVAVTLPARPRALMLERDGMVALVAGLVSLAVAAWIASRLAAGPLNRLSVAAVALGEDLDRPPLIEEGSREVREAAAAFNAMQTRLKAMLQDRTRVLAAIAHDLQTPLTRMRLRVEKVEDAALRERLIADVAATQALVREGLELARIEDIPEDWVRTDIDALVSALCEDAADAGQPVAFLGGSGQVVRARPNALGRCLSNLIDNAVKHGGRAEVSCLAGADGPRILIRDHGPGIPDDQREAVFEPFLRLETSRSRDTGGTGLGLTIARRMAGRTGATLTLRNAMGGGLEALVVLNG